MNTEPFIEAICKRTKSLTDPQIREALKLKDKMTYREIAEHLGVTKNNITWLFAQLKIFLLYKTSSRYRIAKNVFSSPVDFSQLKIKGSAKGSAKGIIREHKKPGAFSIWQGRESEPPTDMPDPDQIAHEPQKYIGLKVKGMSSWIWFTKENFEDGGGSLEYVRGFNGQSNGSKILFLEADKTNIEGRIESDNPL